MISQYRCELGSPFCVVAGKFALWGVILASLAACQPKASESGAKGRTEAEFSPVSSAANVDLDGHGESCALEWGPPPVEASSLNLDGGTAFQFSGDFCGRVEEFRWPLGSGRLDLRTLVHLKVPMDFAFLKRVFTESKLKLDQIPIRLQLVFDGNFGPIKVRETPTLDMVTSAEVSFTEPYNLCTSEIENVVLSNLSFSTPLGDLKVPPQVEKCSDAGDVRCGRSHSCPNFEGLSWVDAGLAQRRARRLAQNGV